MAAFKRDESDDTLCIVNDDDEPDKMQGTITIESLNSGKA